VGELGTKELEIARTLSLGGKRETGEGGVEKTTPQAERVRGERVTPG